MSGRADTSTGLTTLSPFHSPLGPLDTALVAGTHPDAPPEEMSSGLTILSSFPSPLDTALVTRTLLPQDQRGMSFFVVRSAGDEDVDVQACVLPPRFVPRASSTVGAPQQAVRPVFGEENLLQPPFEEVACTPSSFSLEDPALLWMNERPYRICRALGKGGFGYVTKVELLIPFGFRLALDAHGQPRFRPNAEKKTKDAVLLPMDMESNAGPADMPPLKSSGVFFALKTVARSGKATRECLLHEVRMLEPLADSQRIIRIYDHAELSEKCMIFILMELGQSDFQEHVARVVGGEISEAFERRELDAFEIFAWWRQMVLAVQAAHAKGIMHCDLKPANFIVVQTPEAEVSSGCRTTGGRGRGPPHPLLKLCDFGMARELADSVTHRSERSPFGTVRYMSPEIVHNSQAEGNLHITKAVDIWSLGVILHEMLHGGRTPHTHREGRGNVCLLLAIADEGTARVKRECPRLLPSEPFLEENSAHRTPRTCWAVEAGPARSRSTCTFAKHVRDEIVLQRRRHDVLLGLQIACLQHAAEKRPTVDQLAALLETAEQFFGGELGKNCEEGDNEGFSALQALMNGVVAGCEEHVAPPLANAGRRCDVADEVVMEISGRDEGGLLNAGEREHDGRANKNKCSRGVVFGVVAAICVVVILVMVVLGGAMKSRRAVVTPRERTPTTPIGIASVSSVFVTPPQKPKNGPTVPQRTTVPGASPSFLPPTSPVAALPRPTTSDSRPAPVSAPARDPRPTTSVPTPAPVAASAPAPVPRPRISDPTPAPVSAPAPVPRAEADDDIRSDADDISPDDDIRSDAGSDTASYDVGAGFGTDVAVPHVAPTHDPRPGFHSFIGAPIHDPRPGFVHLVRIPRCVK